MDNKTLIARIAKRTGRDNKEIQALTAALAASIRDHCSTLDPIAIPGFGTFDAIKEDETITTDHTTGRRLLLPPAITMKFSPSALLRKKIADAQ
ncbi:MAG: HU family DNA-binding protein [Muribaculaceae bacterium]|nr:HU family DNA-binding protein [Muribaculaceae bacterium]